MTAHGYFIEDGMPFSFDPIFFFGGGGGQIRRRYILTDKRKDTEYFTILFYKMQEHILFGNCKSYAYCILVGLLTLDKVQCSETSVGRFEVIP